MFPLFCVSAVLRWVFFHVDPVSPACQGIADADRPGPLIHAPSLKSVLQHLIYRGTF
jgi:hypothetical protein